MEFVEVEGHKVTFDSALYEGSWWSCECKHWSDGDKAYGHTYTLTELVESYLDHINAPPFVPVNEEHVGHIWRDIVTFQCKLVCTCGNWEVILASGMEKESDILVKLMQAHIATIGNFK